MKRILTIVALVAVSLHLQSCGTTEIVELRPVVVSKPKPTYKPKPRPRTPTPAETKVVNQYD